MKNIVNKDQANQAIRRIRNLSRRLEAREMRDEEKIAALRKKLEEYSTPLIEEELELVEYLQTYYRENKPRNGRKSIRLQHGRIGMHVISRVEVPKDAVDKVPKKALRVKRMVNKKVLKAMGKKALEKAGAKVVNSHQFYVKPFDEDGTR